MRRELEEIFADIRDRADRWAPALAAMAEDRNRDRTRDL
jgi:hypothetical protein